MRAGARRSRVRQVFRLLGRFPVAPLLFILAGSHVHGQLPVARLSSLFPPGGRAGSTVEVAAAGADLDDATHLVFSHTNIISLTNNDGKFVVSIRGDVPPAIYDARIVGRYGISNPRGFVVSDQPELSETSGNSVSSNAMEIPVGAVANGRSDANAVDYFKISLKTGERIFIECLASVIDSRCLPVLTLYDDAGREIGGSRKGSVLDFTPDRDMTAIVKLHDLLFRGGPEYQYRLSVTAGPHIDLVFPDTAVPGTTNKHLVFGRNLPGGKTNDALSADGKPLEQLAVDIVAPTVAHGVGARATEAAGIQGFYYRFSATNGFSNPALIAFAAGPVLAESEPNTRPDQSQMLVPPCDVAGQFYPVNDQDWYTFDAKKGEGYWIEIVSEGLGRPTKPFVLVQRVATNGTASDVKELYDADVFNVADVKVEPRDPSWRLDVGEDATYRLQVRDLFNRIQSDPRHAYRLSVRRDNQSFDLLIATETPLPTKPDSKDARPWPPLLRRGETLPLRVVALRRGFAESISLSVQGLPPGITASPAKIPADKNSVILLLTAADNTPGWAGPVTVIGTGRRGSEEIKREARAAMLVHAVDDKTKEPLQTRLCDNFAFAVSSNEFAPVTIVAAEDKVYEIGATGKVSIPLKIQRQGEFTEAFKLKPAPSSVLEALSEFEVAAKSTNANVEIDLAKQKLGPGEHTLFFRGQVKGKYRRNPEAVALAEQRLKEADKTVADLNAEIKKAEASSATLSADAKAEAEKTLAALKAKLKEAEGQKAAADATQKKAVERAKPQDVTVTVYSAPIRIRVAEEKKVASSDKK